MSKTFNMYNEPSAEKINAFNMLEDFIKKVQRDEKIETLLDDKINLGNKKSVQL